MPNVDEQFRKILAETTDAIADMRSLEARLDERRKLNAIITAYDLATTDRNFVCPSYLMAAIENARSG